MTNGAAVLGRVRRLLAVTLVGGLVAVGCSSDPIAPPELTPDRPGPSSDDSHGSEAPRSAAPAGPTSATTERAIDACALAPADVVRALLGVDQVVEVPEAAPSATPRAGGPGMPTAYRCTYAWSAGRLVLSVLPDSGAGTPQAAVDTVLGKPNQPLPGIGEAAAVDRSGRLGNGYVFLVAAKRTDTTVGAVLVRAPTATPDDKLATLAEHLLAAL